jgi:DNA-directed RNA polymerase specialized sigma24 family protein
LAAPKRIFLRDGRIAMLDTLLRWENAVAAQLATMSKSEIWKRLLAHALQVFAKYGFAGAILPGIGKCAEDYAQEMFIKYALEQIKAKELAYLCTAMRNKIIDDLRKPAQRLTESRANLTQTAADADRRIPSMDDLQSPDKPEIDKLSEETYIARLRVCVESEPDLKEYLEAIVDIGLTKPADIASFLEISPEAVRLRQKKMRRRLVGQGIVQVTR